MADACFVGVKRLDLRAYITIEHIEKALDTFNRRWLFVYGPFGSFTEAVAWRDLYNLPDKEVVTSG